MTLNIHHSGFRFHMFHMFYDFRQIRNIGKGFLETEKKFISKEVKNHSAICLWYMVYGLWYMGLL